MIEHYIKGRFKRRLTSKSKEDAMKELFETTDQPPDILKAIKKREKQFPTGIGQGIGIPRYIGKEIREVILALGLCREGVNFDSLDYKPVKILWMLLAPESMRKEYIEILAHLIRLANSDEFRAGVLNFSSYDSLIELLKETDNGLRVCEEPKAFSEAS